MKFFYIALLALLSIAHFAAAAPQPLPVPQPQPQDVKEKAQEAGKKIKDLAGAVFETAKKGGKSVVGKIKGFFKEAFNRIKEAGEELAGDKDDGGED